jgi:hypothetical protein
MGLDITYVPQMAIKSQALADFVALASEADPRVPVGQTQYPREEVAAIIGSPNPNADW